MKNRISGMLMETGVSYEKLRLHRKGYFDQLMKSNEEVSDSIRPLLKLCREQIDRSILLDRTLLKTLERDPLLSGRLERLRTIPGVGPLTALTWVLEIGDVSRFRSIKQAISYCGLCGEEVRSADKVMRTPISKQSNKHIQSMLLEVARMALRYSPELALLYDQQRQRGDGNKLRSPLHANSWHTWWPWKDDRAVSCRRASSSRPRQRKPFLRREKQKELCEARSERPSWS